MKVAVVYNRESQNVINLFGLPNREKYGLKAIRRITDSLKKGKHQVIALEGDKDLIDKLEEFMPRVMKNERPGMVLNLSYGIQGQARYTHIPGMLEMVGIPYVGSGPLAHSLALDKVVAKMLFRQSNVPTPDFAVLQDKSFPDPDMAFPLIVKPKNEAVSLGIKIVNNQKELREAANIIFDTFDQPVLAEQYIEGREINVGVLGNNPAEAFEPAELIFGKGGPQIYTYEDKYHKSGRTVEVECPAKISPALTARAKEIAINAFKVLGCFDCARVDMRLDKNGNIYVLEVNSLPSLGEHGSYVNAAQAMGLDFPKLVNRMVEVASARYFGTPEPVKLESKKVTSDNSAFEYLVKSRDQMEKRVRKWVELSSRTHDTVGIRLAAQEFGESMNRFGLKPVKSFTDEKNVWTWETQKGFKNGILLISHFDVPVNPNIINQVFRLTPEHLYGEGIGSSRAPLTSIEFSLRALHQSRQLKKLPLGVLCYSDEGIDCERSEGYITQAMAQASKILVLRPGGADNTIILQRRGHRRYRLIAEGQPKKLGELGKKPNIMRILFKKLDQVSALTSKDKKIGVAVMDLKTEAFPFLRPHRVIASVHSSFPNKKGADSIEQEIKSILQGDGLKWSFNKLSESPAMQKKSMNLKLASEIKAVADEWSIPIKTDSSLWPTVAGYAPQSTPIVCGMGPISKDLNTSNEAISRISLVQRTLLLTQFLLKQK